MEIILLFIFCLILMLIGLAGVILPFLPGVPLAWLGLFIFAILTGFEKISLTVTLIFLGLTIVALALDFIVPLLGAKKYQASKYGIIGAFLGLIVGITFFSFSGIIIGPLLGAFLGELIAGRSQKQALRASLGAFFGLLASALLKIVLILIMLGFLIVSL